jgi:hypothetical protein
MMGTDENNTDIDDEARSSNPSVLPFSLKATLECYEVEELDGHDLGKLLLEIKIDTKFEGDPESDRADSA